MLKMLNFSKLKIQSVHEVKRKLDTINYIGFFKLALEFSADKNNCVLGVRFSYYMCI